jgi:hypothetical protein
VATEYSQRPSDILGLEDSWLAYQVDVATLSLARRVEKIMQDDKVDAAVALGRLKLEQQAEPGKPQPVGAGYRPLARPGIPKMKIPESGIW